MMTFWSVVCRQYSGVWSVRAWARQEDAQKDVDRLNAADVYDGWLTAERMESRNPPEDLITCTFEQWMESGR